MHLRSFPLPPSRYTLSRPRFYKLHAKPAISIPNSRQLTQSSSPNMPAYQVAPGADQFYPLNKPTIGTAYPECLSAECTAASSLPPLTIRGVSFKNRIFVSPMCQYSSKDGYATDWHLGFATRGAGAICMEATSVVPEGRISPEDAGLWEDGQIEPLKRIVNFAHAHGTLIEGGWPNKVYGPSELKFADTFPLPKEMDEAHIQYVEDSWIKAVERCKTIGFDFIEIHAAHGYLLHEFVSPLSNVRTDIYGGQPLETACASPYASSRPLFVRVSATDWAEGPEKGEDGQWKQWGIEQTKIYVGRWRSSATGGNWADQKIPGGPGYQVTKKAYPNLPPEQAEGILKDGKADVIFLARALMRDPHWPIAAAAKLGVAVKPASKMLSHTVVNSKK
ncbi:uncharacterized protein B0H18DRAFT_969983 [Fomitopsis serialis]|uniref:uncharacterized protein n=1 Tax=Fomitopsis serialis TaxID=139415 RepID=UPI0020077C28|nr:uncharacterized protein B0H18DRAFT_969983 [Neoantrodia serialis]KAH9937299.1 hypothetical protein B0H18DRAFT_969983 [Neoantrodia serialis]